MFGATAAVCPQQSPANTQLVPDRPDLAPTPVRKNARLIVRANTSRHTICVCYRSVSPLQPIPQRPPRYRTGLYVRLLASVQSGSAVWLRYAGHVG